jgi:3-oxoacyl-[acyl-carrier protein] reductase
MDKKRLAGKWALVTGSARGIGRQIAKGLAELGANIYVHGRTIEHTDKTTAICKTHGVEVVPVAAELSSEAEIAKLVATIKQKTGGVDILYNNAAVQAKWVPIFETDIADWKALFAINLYAPIQLCNAFIPGMKERGYGRIVNLTSGIKDQPHLAPYSVSKAAIDKYTRDAAAELAGTNVLINYLDPGWLKTDLGGKNAWFEVETVIPGALVPILLEEGGPSGEFFFAQAYKYLRI